MRSALDEAVVTAAEKFVEDLGKLNDEPYIRDAIMRIGIREVAWAMLHTFGNKYDVADQLELMADVIRDHKEEKKSA